MSKITIKEDPVTKDQYVDIHEVLAGTGIDPMTVAYYSLDVEGDSKVMITLYDKDKNQIKVANGN